MHTDGQHPGSSGDGTGDSSAVGLTVGVEEEFHLVDPVTLELTPGPRASAAALAGEAGTHVHPEIATTQLETATGVCTSLGQLHA